MAATITEQRIQGERVLVLGATVLIASKSAPGTWHQVSASQCDCKGFRFRGRCRHLKAVAAATPPELPTCRRCGQATPLFRDGDTCASCLATRPAD